MKYKAIVGIIVDAKSDEEAKEIIKGLLETHVHDWGYMEKEPGKPFLHFPTKLNPSLLASLEETREHVEGCECCKDECKEQGCCKHHCCGYEEDAITNRFYRIFRPQ